MADPDWRLLEVFVRVAEKGSLTAAAKALGLSQPTASRAMRELEEHLGATLFVRHSRGLELTPRGAELFTTARALDDGVRAVFRRASGLRETPKGTVRLSVNEPLGVHVLPECFARLRRDFPDIGLEIVIDNAVANLSRREADLAVRMFRPEQLDLVAQRLGDVELGLFASRAYLKRHGRPATIADVARHTLIGSDRDPAWARAIRALGLAPEHFAFRTDDLSLQIEAIVAGVGIGGTHVALANRQPTLERVFPELRFPPLEMWLVVHQDVRENPAVRAVKDALAVFLGRYGRPRGAAT